MPPTLRHATETWFDTAVAWYAGWTLLCVAMVGWSGSLHQLTVAGAVGTMVALTIWILQERSRQRSRPRAEPLGPTWGWRERSGLGALVLVGCLVTLCSHRADHDDAFYIGIANWHALRPHLPILRFDLIHGVEGAPLASAAYAFHSLEMLFGAVTHATGIPAIVVAHLVVAPLAGGLLVFTQTSLARTLGLRRWLWIGCLLIAALLLLGEPHRFPSNFGFVRLYQGKAILLSVLLPWIAVCGLRFAERPGVRSWARLALAQVAAVGLSSTAILLAPLTAGVAVLAARRWTMLDGRHFRVLVTGAAASLYPLAVGLFLSIGTDVLRAPDERSAEGGESVVEEPAVAAGRTMPPPDPPQSFPPSEALELVFGDGALRWWILGCLLIAIAGTRGRSRRFWLFGGAVAVILLVPPIHRVVSSAIGSSHWRTLWVLPIPLSVAVALDSAGWALARTASSTALDRSSLRKLSPRVPGSGAGLAGIWLLRILPVGLFFALVPVASVFTAPTNPAAWGAPGLKVSTEWSLVAELVRDVAPQPSSASPATVPLPMVLLPAEYTVWVSTIPGAAVVPMVVRPWYLDDLEGSLSATEIRAREQLHRWVSRHEPRQPEAAIRRFQSAIRTHDFAAIGWRPDSGWDRLLDMGQLGYTLWHEDDSVQIWVRRP